MSTCCQTKQALGMAKGGERGVPLSHCMQCMHFLQKLQLHMLRCHTLMCITSIFTNNTLETTQDEGMMVTDGDWRLTF